MANYGDKLTHRLTVRLTDTQFNFLLASSEIYGVSPSDYMRMILNAGYVASKKEYEKYQALKEGTSNENVKTLLDNKL